MMKRVIVFVAGFFMIAAGVLYAGEKSSTDVLSPVGQWKTIDDDTNEPESIVEIWQESDGTLSGKIVEVLKPLEPDEDPSRPCTECKGELKDKPVVGMKIMWEMRPKNKGQTAKWHDGHILDPDNGETYGCNLSLSDDGKVLEVRGFIGFSLLGRTQVWHRLK